jgi:nucleotide-binding universal stress UspA family protein
MFNTILAATDKVILQDQAVLAALKITNQNQSKLHILHVLEPGSENSRYSIHHFKTREDFLASVAYEEAVREALFKQYSGDMQESSGNLQIKILRGVPWEKILRYAGEIQTDLIVMGRQSIGTEEDGGKMASDRIGSTFHGITMHEKCPVLIINQSVVSEELTFKKILVGIDFSKSCECALRFAAGVSRHYRSNLFIFHMIPIPPSPTYSQKDYLTDIEKARERLIGFCSPFLKGIDHEYNIWGGAIPDLEMKSCAKKNDVDMIVMGSHTKEQKGKWYTGSSVARLSYQFSRPVAVLTDPSALLPWEDKLEIGLGTNRPVPIINT